MSVAVAESVAVPESIALAAGAVNATVGRVVSPVGGGVVPVYSNAPISGAVPEYVIPVTGVPASIRSDPAARVRNVISGREPSDFRTPRSWLSVILTKSAFVTTRLFCQLLLVIVEALLNGPDGFVPK